MPTVDRYELIRRKYDLAQRMIVRGARTSTVTQWTGLTDYRVQQIARRFAPNRGTGRRGKSPYTARYFARSPEMEAESLAFVWLAIEADVIPEDVVIGARHHLPELQRGERLLEAYTCYAALLRSVHLPLERAISLVYAFASRQQLFLRNCNDCDDWMLTQRFARNIRCPFCRKTPHRRSNVDRKAPSDAETVPDGVDRPRSEGGENDPSIEC